MTHAPEFGVRGGAARGWTLLDRAVVALSLIGVGFLLVDPLMQGVARDLHPDARAFFRSFTDLGKSGWILVPTALAAAILHRLGRKATGRRQAAAYGLGAQAFAFVFTAVAVPSLLSSLVKNIIGRARPKHFDALGPVAFQPFTFEADFAAFPSGHATTIMALGAALAILWPRRAVPILAVAAWIAATRVLIGAHYFTDVAGGAALGVLFAYALRDRLAARRWLFERRQGRTALRGGRLWRVLDGWPARVRRPAAAR